MNLHDFWFMMLWQSNNQRRNRSHEWKQTSVSGLSVLLVSQALHPLTITFLWILFICFVTFSYSGSELVRKETKKTILSFEHYNFYTTRTTLVQFLSFFSFETLFCCFCCRMHNYFPFLSLTGRICKDRGGNWSDRTQNIFWGPL